MNEAALIQAMEKRLINLISTEADVFLVEIRIKPTNNIKVFLDGDEGLSIERLVQYNRRFYKQLEEENFYPNGDFSLEVSSPGLEEPLKMHRQYLKNTGRFVEVTENEGDKKEGKLLQVTESAIVVEEIITRLTGKNKDKVVGQGKGKKMPTRMNRSDGETVQHTIPFDNIKTTKIQIKF